MRLLNVETRLMEDFVENYPDYAILSHTWGSDEVTFQDLKDPGHTKKLGYAKIDGCCREAARRDIYYVWVDTCCIDKTSSAELSEAINSMFTWYAGSRYCFIYLSDVPREDVFADNSAFRTSRWFTRGWTLQEYLAPRDLIFFGEDWTGIKQWQGNEGVGTLQWASWESELLQEITKIDKSRWKTTGIAEKLSWAARRKTTREEDAAYCLLGLFGINMPLLYGEGSRAWGRLMEEIAKTSNHHEFLAAGFDLPCTLSDSPNTLATSPAEFRRCDKGFFPRKVPGRSTSSHFSMTNAGLHIELPLIVIDDMVLALLNCTTKPSSYGSSYPPICRIAGEETRLPGLQVRGRLQLAIPLRKLDSDHDDVTYTTAEGSQPLMVPYAWHHHAQRKTIYMKSVPRQSYAQSGIQALVQASVYVRFGQLEQLGYDLHSWYPPCPFRYSKNWQELCLDVQNRTQRVLLVFSRYTSMTALQHDSIWLYLSLFWDDEFVTNMEPKMKTSKSKQAADIVWGASPVEAALDLPRRTKRRLDRYPPNPIEQLARVGSMYKWQDMLDLRDHIGKKHRLSLNSRDNINFVLDDIVFQK